MSHSVVLLDLYFSDLPHQHVWGMENGNQTLDKSNALVNLTVICNYIHNTWHCTDTCVNSTNTGTHTFKVIMTHLHTLTYTQPIVEHPLSSLGAIAS